MVDVHKGDFANPISGFSKGTPPLSLLESVESIKDKVPFIINRAAFCLTWAKEHAKKLFIEKAEKEYGPNTPIEFPKEGFTHVYGVSLDEAAAIRLYTLNWTPKDDSLYIVLNQILREADRSKAIPFFPYLHLLFSALSHLPEQFLCKKKTVYRGIQGTLKERFVKDTGFIWWGFSSCTSDLGQLKEFLGSGPKAIFCVSPKVAYNIAKFSAFEKESEVLLPPGRYLRVTSTPLEVDTLTMVDLEEVKMPPSILST